MRLSSKHHSEVHLSSNHTREIRTRLENSVLCFSSQPQQSLKRGSIITRLTALLAGLALLWWLIMNDLALETLATSLAQTPHGVG